MSSVVNLRILVAAVVTFSFHCYSQTSIPFKVRHQEFVKGDMTMIANNIVNTNSTKNNSSISYNERTLKGKLNDELSMQYIDIDDDKTTFSSSSADLILENSKNKKIIYAGLYWSATYKYNVGKLTRKQKFEAEDEKREHFDTIKIKLPNQELYTEIKGELIFDGLNHPKFNESAPYVMFADITNLVKNYKNAYGTYTIANVKSTKGKISGGVSAGWSIFFIYEDPEMTEKFITCYDGFAGITNQSLDIPFTGFQTLTRGNVNAKIACAALEGDYNLKGDQFLFKSKSNDFVQLSNINREKSNIFNSSITIENEIFKNRKPNSSNTLGYDSFIMSIDNPNNSIIGNATNRATLRLKTYGDRYFIFYTAFSVEVTQPKKINVENISTTIVDISKDIEPSASIKNIEVVQNNILEKTTENAIIQENKQNTVTSFEKNSDKINLNKIEKLPTDFTNTITTIKKEAEKVVVTKSKSIPSKTIAKRITAIESSSVAIPSAAEGYYIIANVFSKHSNATRFVAALKKKGILADYFINPLNNYRYVYVSSHSNFKEASNYYNSNLDDKYFGALWIMTVNKQNNSGYAFNYKSSVKFNSKTVFSKETTCFNELKYYKKEDI